MKRFESAGEWMAQRSTHPASLAMASDLERPPRIKPTLVGLSESALACFRELLRRHAAGQVCGPDLMGNGAVRAHGIVSPKPLRELAEHGLLEPQTALAKGSYVIKPIAVAMGAERGWCAWER